jgi:AcrR family transcriptional regulator
MIRSVSHPASFDRSREAILAALAEHLVTRPEASLGQLAQLIGVGRTTLHRLFPTRQALLQAVALDALNHLTEVYKAGLAEAFTKESPPEVFQNMLERFVALLVPLGPRLTFLLRLRELDHDALLTAKSAELDGMLEAALERAQGLGLLHTPLGVTWLMTTLYALIYVAWEQVAAGRLAALDAPRLVVETWLRGVGTGFTST